MLEIVQYNNNTVEKAKSDSHLSSLQKCLREMKNFTIAFFPSWKLGNYIILLRIADFTYFYISITSLSITGLNFGKN